MFCNSRVKKAVVALDKLLVTLEEIHDLISQLWKVKLSWFCLEEIFFVNCLSYAIELLGSIFMEGFFNILLKNAKVFFVTAE